MSRISICQACINEKHGIKTRIAALHTCGVDVYPRRLPRRSAPRNDGGVRKEASNA
ncbi:MAG: hypothetical protein RJQ09_21240 [Cyclobacteriaceae bacterium]